MRKRPPSPPGQGELGQMRDLYRALEIAAAHHQAGRYDEAKQHYRRILAANPRNTDALNLFGVLRAQLGELEEAASLLRRAVAGKPNDSSPYFNLASVLKQRGALAEAEAAYRRALALDPDNADIHNHLGILLRESGRANEAVAAYSEALRLAPRDPALHYNLANILKEIGRFDEAEKSYRLAIALDPRSIEARNNLASVLNRQERKAEAESLYREIVALAPGSVLAHNNLGIHLHSKGRLEEAFACFVKATQLDPAYADAHANQGAVLMEVQDFPAARKACMTAVALDPGQGRAFVDLCCVRKYLCDWTDRDDQLVRLGQITEDQLSRGVKTALPPFEALSFPCAPTRQLAIAKAWSRDIEDKVAPLRRERNFAKTPRERLRVGYLSNDFRNHAMAHLIQGLFGLHDRAKVEVFAYSFTVDDANSYLHRIRSDCDGFADIRALSSQDAAERIFSDGIDVLVDLKGYTEGARPEILALRPAPVQVSYIGFPASMGASFIDYVIADGVVLPKGDEGHYSEAVVRLPDCYLMVDDQQKIAEISPAREQMGLPLEAFVFCSFNNAHKIEPQIFDVWMRILRRVPGSVLWLLTSYAEVQSNLRREAELRGVAPERLIFATVVPKDLHLARHRLADLFLDTRSYNAHTTAVDALWAGLLLLTYPGRSFATRVAASLLQAVGMPEVIVDNLDAYEELAVRLAANPQELAELKSRLQGNLGTTPLFQSAARARHLEAAYSAMWQRFAAGLPPGPIDLAGQSAPV